MNNWIRNIQGQLTELASEVLQEATSEVEDPESELQVERKKRVEAEKLFFNEKTRAEQLEKRILELEEQLYSLNLQKNSDKEKIERIIANKDLKIKNLEKELNNFKFNQDADIFQNVVLTDKLSNTTEETTVLDENSLTLANKKLFDEINLLKEKHESEVLAILSLHKEDIQRIHEEYEKKIQKSQTWDSTNDDEKGAAQEKEILDLKNALEAVHEENQKTIVELKTQLIEKENELHKLHKTNFISGEENLYELEKRSDDGEKRPPSVTGTDSAGSNNGWERMGAEFIASEGQTRAPSNSSSCSISEKILDNRKISNDIKIEKDNLTNVSMLLAKEEKAFENKKVIESLEKQLANAQLEIESYVNLLEKKNEELREQKTVCAMAKDLSCTNEKKVIENEELCSKLNKQCDEYKKTIKILNNNLNETTTLVEKLRDENSILLNDIKNINLELEEANCKISEQLSQYNSLLDEKNKNDNCLKSSKLLNDQLEQQLINLQAACHSEQSFEKIEFLDSLQIENNQLKLELKEINEKLHNVQTENHKQINLNDRHDQSIQTNSLSEEKINNMTCEPLENVQKEHNLTLEEMETTLKNLRNENSIKNDELKRLEADIIETNHTINKLNAIIAEKDQTNINILAEKATLEQQLCEFKLILEKNNSNDMSEIENLREEISLLQKTNKEEEKNYKNLLLEIQQKDDIILQIKEDLELHKNKSITNETEKVRLNKELSRLLEHLVKVEDISTKEAILAEERETQLRNEIRNLQNETQNCSENAKQHLNQYQDEINTLKEQVLVLEANNTKITSLYEERQHALDDSTKALTNLQDVVRELEEEHKQELEICKNKYNQLEENHKKLLNDYNNHTNNHSKLTENLEEINKEILIYRTKIEKQSKIIEDLENEIAELSFKKKDKCTDNYEEKNFDENNLTFANKKPSTTTYKIDDTTLKQLFYSYFLADKEKQPEIALVMTSILGYSSEERATIEEAVYTGSNNSWFKFGNRKSGGNTKHNQMPSLTEQFIRFLENESRAFNEQPTLFVAKESVSNSGLNLTNVPEIPFQELLSQKMHSSSDLKEILES